MEVQVAEPITCSYCKNLKWPDEMQSRFMCLDCRKNRTSSFVKRLYHQYLDKARARARASSKEQRKKFPSLSTENAEIDRANHPERARARNAVRSALRNGKLAKQPCAICGSPSTHAHHWSYDEPLEVTWLCPIHHKEVHYAEDA